MCALAVCTIGTPTTETVSQPFVPQPVPAGDCLWVSLEIVADADVCTTAEMTGAPVTVGVTGQTLTFDGGVGPVTVAIPPGVVTFSPSNGTAPMTSFDGSAWQTVASACGSTEVRFAADFLGRAGCQSKAAGIAATNSTCPDLDSNAC